MDHPEATTPLLAAGLVPPRPAWAEIDTAAIADNTRKVVAAIAPVPLMAVVKADGFGHGVVESGRAALAGGAAQLAVATVDEGIALRRAGITAPILVLATTLPRLAPVVVAHDLAIALATEELAAALAAAARAGRRRARVHLKVDTGLHRLGVAPERAAVMLGALASMPEIEVLGVFTTLIDADDPDPVRSRAQHAVFLELLRALERDGLRPPLAHCTDSPMVLRHPEMNLDLVRAARLIFGVTPWRPAEAAELGLRPCLAVRAEIVFLQEVPTGDTVGFGPRLRAERDMRVALLPLGFADVGRMLSGEAEVLIGEARVPVVAVESDQTLVDVSRLAEVRIGDAAVLLGRQGEERIDLVEVMARTGLSGGTLCTGLGARLARVYTRGGAPWRLRSFLDTAD